MSRMKDLTGQKFGKLTAIKPTRKDKNGRWLWLLSCECGNDIERSSSTLVKSITNGNISHCGCSPALKTHGLSKQFKKLRWVWVAMRQRCNNPNCKDYPHYGGRGITIYDGWSSFENFHFWAMLTGYKDGVTIERQDVNGNYCPENCTWIVNEEQPLNRTNTNKFEYEGEMRDLREISQMCGVNYYTLKTRLVYMGWSIQRATTEIPVKGKNQTYKVIHKC